MADLQQTDAQHKRFFREALFLARLARVVLELQRRFKRERVQILNLNDVTSATPHFTACTLTGVDLHAATPNTDEEGFLYVRITGGGPFQVSLYRATGGAGGNEVARVASLAASATGTWVAQNSSGLGGSVTLGATVVAETDDKHRLQVFPDYRGQLLKLWPSDGTTDDDSDSREVAKDLLDNLGRRASGMLDAIRAAAPQLLLSSSDNPIARGNAFTKTSETSLLLESVTDDAGAITRTRTGWLEVFRKAWVDETTGSTQDVLERVVTAAAAVFESGNDGLGAIAGITLDEFAPVGEVRGICVAGLGTAEGGAERFRLEFSSAAGEDEEGFVLANQMTVKKSYKGQRGLGAWTLLRTHTKTGDGSNLNLGVAGIPGTTTFSFVGENETNTDSGTLYWTIVANASNFDVEWYSDSARTNLVAKVENQAAAATSVLASAQNGSGLSITHDIGSAPVATTQGTVDLNFFNAGANGVTPDEFRITISLGASGTIQKLWGLLFGYYLNSISAAPQHDDALGRVNTFPSYIAEDL